ncbi:hypothetical protein YT1_4696 [Rhodococcus ruber]|nr:hypothetical protein YT1_4696 [Rhodococcus ruber]
MAHVCATPSEMVRSSCVRVPPKLLLVGNIRLCYPSGN